MREGQGGCEAQQLPGSTAKEVRGVMREMGTAGLDTVTLCCQRLGLLVQGFMPNVGVS